MADQIPPSPGEAGSEFAAFAYQGKTVPLPVVAATEGRSAVNLSGFSGQTGLTAYDQGFVNTSSTKSAITYLDGEAGILRYRGYPIEELAKFSNFLETAYLLIYGELPTPAALADFDDRIRRRTLLHEDFRRFFDALPHDSHPMSVLAAGVSALSTFHQDSLDPLDPAAVELSTINLLAKVPVIAAYAHKKTRGEAYLYPDNSLSFVDNFLRLNFGVMSEPYRANPVISAALDRLLLLHADHEQNASTSTVRLVGSTRANLYASVSAGINALFGPLHGGANEAVLHMLAQIRDSGISVHEYVSEVKRGAAGIRLMGFGHRVYKNWDPRAKLVKATAETVLNELGVHDPLLDIAMELEGIALADPYFQERHLYPNVDFYTGIIYKAMGFPTAMFTVLFAIGRLPGWIAHWRELVADPATRLGRPHQVYVGPVERHYPAGFAAPLG
ncbi:MAG: citrate synthase [Pseudoclavibacter sp.]